ncbi:MAG TPA: hypothetical protein VD926_05515 [Acidimicrobiales bacterium]|nr:hypothetical protein [Acidimicrobiales bacterium]
MTRPEILSAVRNRLNQPGTAVLTDNKLYQAFNDAKERVDRELLPLSARTAVELTANTREYAFLTAFPNLIEVSSVHVLDSAGGDERLIDFIPWEGLPADFMTWSAANPLAWSVRGDEVLVLHPKPATTIASGLIVYGHVYSARLAEDSSADVTVLPYTRRFREVLIRATMLHAIEMDLEDPVLAVRLDGALLGYEQEVEKLLGGIDRPLARPLVVGGRPGRRQSLGARMTPGGYVTIR